MDHIADRFPPQRFLAVHGFLLARPGGNDTAYRGFRRPEPDNVRRRALSDLCRAAPGGIRRAGPAQSGEQARARRAPAMSISRTISTPSKEDIPDSPGQRIIGGRTA